MLFSSASGARIASNSLSQSEPGSVLRSKIVAARPTAVASIFGAFTLAVYHERELADGQRSLSRRTSSRTCARLRLSATALSARDTLSLTGFGADLVARWRFAAVVRKILV